ncbi:unnamed protein product [Adineta steineri]|uniref:Uncharacterized protein n=1 Tax=Adineta steineri TaxID=433720 RepID=A0A819CJ67_9BILA|nr:unnamed protein product [Adineta steineri]CAF1413370.1 unnamed protein product [Adineta steineri]CAF1454227.1 unnamed protein product [Adineta steineri]CAF3605841.1 unnamed protein product [Adineta steineri]CAF3813192.1 unnamed protein product [Adineta steineri]
MLTPHPPSSILRKFRNVFFSFVYSTAEAITFTADLSDKRIVHRIVIACAPGFDDVPPNAILARTGTLYPPRPTPVKYNSCKAFPSETLSDLSQGCIPI